jgi:hypothetical protein
MVDKSSLTETEANIESPATVDRSPDLASTCVPVIEAPWASKILTGEGMLGVVIFLLSC